MKVSEEKVCATTDGSERSQALLDKFSEHEVEFIFCEEKQYNFAVKKLRKQQDFDIFNSHLNSLNKKFHNNIPVTNSQ